ncbi:UNVERIFIED_CONTAM: hypothetical protein RMT77_001080 [Armadillidium vulgare]
METNTKTSEADESFLCSWCGEIGEICCGSCGEVWYCSKEHKRLHWEDHFRECKPFKINSDPMVGMHLSASRNIKAGTFIFKDEPLVIGPLGTSDLVCLSCYSPILEEDFFKCPDCFWPMCSMSCALDESHAVECSWLEEDKTHCGAPTCLGETPRYDLIFILRCLILKERNPKAWRKMFEMASHGDKLKESNEPHQVAAVRYFKDICKMNIGEDEIHHIRGVVLANAIEIRSKMGTIIKVLYPTVRFLNHSCIPNVHLTSTIEGQMEIRAAIDINKGDELTICYTGTDLPIWERQSCLVENHFFTCMCKRCRDPTELGSYFSSPRCPVCPSVIMHYFVQEEDITWRCPKCHSESSVDEIIQEIHDWTFRLEMNDLFGTGSPSKISHALAMIEQRFHIKHYMWLRASQKALQKLQYNNSFSALKLKRYIWEKINEIFDYIEPGITRRKGMTLTQLANAILVLADDRFIKEEETSKRQSENYLQEARSLYEEAFKILRQEPKGTPENKVADSLLFKISSIYDKLQEINTIN